MCGCTVSHGQEGSGSHGTCMIGELALGLSQLFIKKYVLLYQSADKTSARKHHIYQRHSLHTITCHYLRHNHNIHTHTHKHRPAGCDGSVEPGGNFVFVWLMGLRHVCDFEHRQAVVDVTFHRTSWLVSIHIRQSGGHFRGVGHNECLQKETKRPTSNIRHGELVYNINHKSMSSYWRTFGKGKNNI